MPETPYSSKSHTTHHIIPALLTVVGKRVDVQMKISYFNVRVMWHNGDREEFGNSIGCSPSAVYLLKQTKLFHVIGSPGFYRPFDVPSEVSLRCT